MRNHRPTPIGYEARCEACGEAFNPSTPTDLEHVVRDDDTTCGGTGVLVGAWRRRRTLDRGEPT